MAVQYVDLACTKAALVRSDTPECGDYNVIASTDFAGTDTRRMEELLEINVQILERISSEFSGLRAKGRMA